MTIKVLMLEDFIEDADLISRQLKKDKINFTGKRVDTENEFRDALSEFVPDIILSDNSLPQFNSLAALKIAKQKIPNVPFILVTGSVSEEFAVSCMKSGADDYILKSNLARLASAINACLSKHHLEEENIVIKKLNKEIEEKNHELDYLNQEKDRFISIVSHDLQNHLSAMVTTLNLMKASVSGISEKRDSHIKRLERSLTNTRTLLGDFLTVNRIQRGVINPLYNLVNMGNLVQEVTERYEDVATRKEITIHYSNNCMGSFFKTDASYFAIITDNLVSNAIKYTDKGKNIWVDISKKNGKYVLTVKDEGQGIPESDMPKMYGRFQRLSTKPTNNEPSNGLGLSIVKDLIDALGGSIKCNSKVGHGTTFTVTF